MSIKGKKPVEKTPKSKSAPKRPRGRPQKTIDPVTLKKLGGIFCTEAEAAGFLDIGIDTLRQAFKRDPSLKKMFVAARESGKASLRRHQFVLSQKNATMAIFMGKQYLGQKDFVEPAPTGPNVVWDAAALAKLSTSELHQLYALSSKLGLATPGSDLGGNPKT